ncbi:MAG: response regulator transcription factor [Acidobacteria bacterium]|nr:response regulator transcription factor [Acidobacteriota bacterium]
MRTDETIQVAIVEDDRLTREGLAVLINGTPGYRCASTYRSVEDALASMGATRPDVILLDIDLPGISGSKGVRILREKFPWLQVLMLTVYAEEDKIFESMCNGACGYLLKKTPPARILAAIREVHEGGAPMSPEIARKVVMLFQKTARPERIEEDLTPHEVRLLRLLSEGHSYQAVADRLHISINTVRNYIRTIYDKLHAHSKAEAVSKALKSRIIV